MTCVIKNKFFLCMTVNLKLIQLHFQCMFEYGARFAPSCRNQSVWFSFRDTRRSFQKRPSLSCVLCAIVASFLSSSCATAGECGVQDQSKFKYNLRVLIYKKNVLINNIQINSFAEKIVFKIKIGELVFVSSSAKQTMYPCNLHHVLHLFGNTAHTYVPYFL